MKLMSHRINGYEINAAIVLMYMKLMSHRINVYEINAP